MDYSKYKKIKLDKIASQNIEVTIYVQATKSVNAVNKQASMTLIFDKNGEFTTEFQRQFNNFGKETLLRQIKTLNSSLK